MKKNTILKIAAIVLPTFFLFSCQKDTLDPIAGSNGSIVVNNISINGFVPTDSTTLSGVSKIEYLVPNDSISTKIDTIGITDTFTFENLSGYTRSYSLLVPTNTVQVNFKMYVIIGKGGTATSVKATSIQFDYNGKSYLNDPITFEGFDDYFYTPLQAVKL